MEMEGRSEDRAQGGGGYALAHHIDNGNDHTALTVEAGFGKVSRDIAGALLLEENLAGGAMRGLDDGEQVALDFSGQLHFTAGLQFALADFLEEGIGQRDAEDIREG